MAGFAPLREVTDLDALLRPEARGEPSVPPFPGVAQVTPDRFHPYLRLRGYTEEVLETGFDFWTSTEKRWATRLILPYYDPDGTYVTFTGRTILPDQEPRYMHGSEGMGRWLYGVHRLAHITPTRIWIVEGQFDAIRLASLGEFPLCLSGNTATNRQLMDILRVHRLTGAKVITALDRFAEIAQKRLWGELISIGVPAMEADVGAVAKDPGELSYETHNRLLDQLGLSA